MPTARLSGLRPRRLLAVGAMTAIGLTLGAGVAFAHVTVNPNTALAGSYPTLSFHVPNESAKADTVKVTVDFPMAHPFASVSVLKQPGWTAVTTTTKLSTPISDDDNASITEAVSSITWTADPSAKIALGQFAEFDVSVGPVPKVASLSFDAIQTYDDGSVVKWDEPTPASGVEPEKPGAGAHGDRGSDSRFARRRARPHRDRHREPGHRRARARGRFRQRGADPGGGRHRGRRLRPAGRRAGPARSPTGPVVSDPVAGSAGRRARHPDAARHPRRSLARLAAALLLALGVMVGLVGSASAHDVLISSNPKDGATLSNAPTSITFTFDQPVQNFDPVVSLIGPDGKQYATGTPTISGNVVTGSVGSGPAGAYTAAYRIVSADGHPVTGEIHFTLTTGHEASSPPSAAGSVVPGTTSPGTGTSAAPPSIAAPRSGSGGLSAWVWIGLILAAVVVAAAGVVLLRRPAPGARPDKDY